MTLRETPLWQKRQQLDELRKKQHQEFVQLHREWRELVAQLANTCEHDFVFNQGVSDCIKCGISKEQYKYHLTCPLESSPFM